MPQISPMKWFILNILTQSSMLQIISFLSAKKMYTKDTQMPFYLPMNKMIWKW